MRRPLVSLAVAAALALAACGGDDGPKDDRVASGVEGSGERELLADRGFREALREIGVRPKEGDQLGHDLGHRIRSIVTDSGLLDPSLYSQPYRGLLENRGRLSLRAYEKKYGGHGPVAMADRLGAVLGPLEAKLDEGEGSELARSITLSFGAGPTEGKPRPANGIRFVTQRCIALLPGRDPYPAAQQLRSSFLFHQDLEPAG